MIYFLVGCDVMKKNNYSELGKAFLLIISYMVLIPEIIVLVFQSFNLDLRDPSINLLANVLVYVLMFLVLLFVYRKTIFKEFIDFFKNFKKYGKVSVSYWIKGLVFMLLTNSIVIIITGGIAANEAGNRASIMTFPIFSILSMTILGPFLEEMLFRKGFKHAFKKETTFLIVTSLLFGSAHLLASFAGMSFNEMLQNWTQILFIIPYGGFGYFFGKAYLETDNIFTSVLSHMCHNTLSVLIVLLGV